MSTRLEDNTALATGATSNIDRAIATAFAAEGAHVIVSARSPQRGAEVVEQIHAAGGHAEFIAADLDGSAHASRALADDATTRALGVRIDVLVNKRQLRFRLHSRCRQHRHPALARLCAVTDNSRDLPMPGSPRSTSACPRSPTTSRSDVRRLCSPARPSKGQPQPRHERRRA